MKIHTKSRLENSSQTQAITTIDESSVTLIEIHGALGILIALSREGEEKLHDVVYFRLQQFPSAKHFKSIIIEKIGNHWIPKIERTNQYLYEPSLIRYQRKSISREEYIYLTEAVISYQSEKIVETVKTLFNSHHLFEINDQGHLIAASNYAAASPDTFADFDFLIPPSKTCL